MNPPDNLPPLPPDPTCGHCGKPRSKHFDEDELYCTKTTTGDLFSEEPNDDFVLEMFSEEQIEDAKRRWKLVNGHIEAVRDEPAKEPRKVTSAEMSHILQEMIDKAKEPAWTPPTRPHDWPTREIERQCDRCNSLFFGPALGGMTCKVCADKEPASGVEARVCEDIAARQRLGIAKYGCTVEQSGDDMLTHAYQEALDLSVYLRAEIERRGDLQRQLAEAKENEAAMSHIAVSCQCPSKDAELAILRGKLAVAREALERIVEINQRGNRAIEADIAREALARIDGNIPAHPPTVGCGEGSTRQP